MPFPVELPRTFAQRLAEREDTSRALAGMWVCSGSPLIAEICAGSGLDWVLIDVEHSINTLTTVTAQLQAVAASPATPMVRLPWLDTVQIKQYLDAGVQNLLIPMVDDADAARSAVAAVRYPGESHGVRGVGAALARASRWGRVPDYLAHASDTVSLFVQIETAEAVRNVEAILDVEGIDGVFVGPADLAASMGLLGQPEHDDVVAAVERCQRAAATAGKPAGVNAFNPDKAQQYQETGFDFILVGADVTLVARGSENLSEIL